MIKEIDGRYTCEYCKREWSTILGDNQIPNFCDCSETAKELWKDLGDIPIDEDECIEIPFLDFMIGTDREEIWHWFEDNFKVKVVDLMYGGK